ncbi:hypothetical protein [Cellulophaga sp. BC115SP]|uniref:hypothetical protein n=1 Tax=Cellulophaga sp. BC115SP TaxID=2683263 RepID=UPI0014132841|nr:hypothetical protein [Cellulophaga sp. BC115SP]NBB27442.1 hypothetical protein [Cellulophaga sp. BC115SP]
MNIQEIDLDKYFNAVQEISNNILVVLPQKEKEAERVSLVLYSLQKRRIIRGDSNISKWEIRFKERLKEVERTIEVLEKESDRYLGLFRFGIKYLLLNSYDIEMIQHCRKVSFDFEKDRYLNQLKTNLLPTKVFIESTLDKLNYTYMLFYQNGEIIQINEPKDNVIYNFSNDLGVYDFIMYLKNELIEQNNVLDIDSTKWNLPKRLQLLERIGFFELEEVKNITSNRRKGELINQILGISDDNTRKYIDTLRVWNKASEKNKEEIEFFLKKLR